MKVYQAINKVQAALAQDGITKGHRNQQQGYAFRGIDDVYNALAPLLAKHGLCILPRFLHRQCEERKTSKNTSIFFVTVEAEFDIVCAEDGSKHVARTYGEAMDSADKATNKAMSAAYKYAAFQVFAIPTEGNNDADSTTPDAGTAIAKAPKQEMQSTPKAEEEPKVVPSILDKLLDYVDKFTDKKLATFEKAMEDVVGPRMGLLNVVEEQRLKATINDMKSYLKEKESKK